MMRRRVGRPGLIGTMARTAAVARTATAVSGGMQRRQQAKAAAEESQAAQQAAFESQTQLADMQQQLAAMQAQQAAAPAPAAGGDDFMAKLQQLAQLNQAGVLSDEEFAAAKAKLLA
jgi:Short C-terminal domain